jgi:hypothetical protein
MPVDHSDPLEFTDREKFVLSYFRDRELSSSRGYLGYDLAFLVGSIVCGIFALIREDRTLEFVAYALLLGRLTYSIVQSRRWLGTYRGIFAKYDGRIKLLNEALRKFESRGE